MVIRALMMGPAGTGATDEDEYTALIVDQVFGGRWRPVLRHGCCGDPLGCGCALPGHDGNCHHGHRVNWSRERTRERLRDAHWDS